MLFSKMNSETFRSFAYASLFKPAGFELCNITSLPQCMGESSKEGADEDFVILCGNRSDELTQFLESFPTKFTSHRLAILNLQKNWR